MEIHILKSTLRVDISLVGSLTEPVISLLVILWYTLSIGVHKTQSKLRLAVTLVSRLTEPDQCLLVILRYSLTIGVHLP
ncbi:hypothetical protein D3C87_1568880 [compost metagenome]